MVCKVQAALENSLHSGEAASADNEATRAFTAEFKKIIGENNFHQT